MLWKGIYPYKYMDGWEKFNKALLPEMKFHSSVTMEYITDGN